MTTFVPAKSPFVNLEERTFEHEESLPSLPLAPLDQALAKYLESVRPHVTEKEYLQTEAIVREFESGEGKRLYKKLQERASNSRNWLEEWWEEYTYLRTRDPSAILVNAGIPGTCILHEWPAEAGTQLERAALHAWLTMQYWQLLRKEQLTRDKDRQGNSLSMYQFKRLFSSCRTPGEHCDQLNHHFKTETEGPSPRHVCVLCKGRIFTFDVMDSNYQIYTALEIQEQLRYISDLCAQEPSGPEIGALTSENRSTWWKLRNHLLNLHPDNKNHLKTIETAIYALVLAEGSPSSFHEICMEGITGDCSNRWFDKAWSTVVHQNGTICCNSDHGPMDGMVYVSLCLFIDLAIQSSKGKWTGSHTVRPLPKPQELQFVVDNVIRKGVEDAKVSFKVKADNIDLVVPSFDGFGKKFIRDHKLHPDTFVQLCLQLSYYRIYKKPAPTYETATTRKYYHARTETVRSCTMEALEFSKAMVDPSVKPEQRHKLLWAAHDKHNKLMREAQNNHGCDRLLFGLSLLAEEESMSLPAIYSDTAWTKSGGGGNFILSTSFLGYAAVYGGVTAMCKDGYGIFYCMDMDKILFWVTSWQEDEDTSAQDMWSSIIRSLNDMKALLELTGKV